MAELPDGPVLLGRILGAHGIRGAVLVRSYGEVPERIAAYGPLVDKAGGSYALSSPRATAKGVVVHINGLTDRNAAEALAGTELYVPRERLPPPQNEEFYHADLVGMTAVNSQAESVGRVIAVHNFGAGDILEIGAAEGTGNTLIPFTCAFVPEIDVGTRRLVIVMPAVAEDEPDQDLRPEPARVNRR